MRTCDATFGLPAKVDERRAFEVACQLRNVYPLDGIDPLEDGETPHLVERDSAEEQRERGVPEDDVDPRLHVVEVHAGCGCEGPEVVAVVPYDVERGAPDRALAEAIRDAGGLLAGLLNELAEARAALAAELGLPEGALPGWRWGRVPGHLHPAWGFGDEKLRAAVWRSPGETGWKWWVRRDGALVRSDNTSEGKGARASMRRVVEVLASLESP